jgi:arginase
MTIRIIGVPMDLGAGRRGVDMGPSAMRIAGVAEKLRALGHTVIDEGDISIKVPEQQKIKNEKLKYLPEIARAVTVLASKVEKILTDGHFPLVLGGDHSIAIGTIAGLASFCKKNNKRLGVIWVDAHGDLNTPETTPSGNIHGMPLAVALGHGAIELTSVGGIEREVEPANVVMIGVRSLDPGERDFIHKIGINIYPMPDVDKYGIHRIMERALKKIRERVDVIHVSFDLDSVDPSVAPGVGTPVRGGLSYREAHLIMETIAECNCMNSLEVVEVNPILDNRNQSAEFACELIASSMGMKII